MADKRAIQLPNSDEELKKLYFSNERCAALVFPFKNFNFDPIVLKAQSDRLTPDMRSLMEDVINATPRPPYIKVSCTNFNNIFSTELRTSRQCSSMKLSAKVILSVSTGATILMIGCQLTAR